MFDPRILFTDTDASLNGLQRIISIGFSPNYNEDSITVAVGHGLNESRWSTLVYLDGFEYGPIVQFTSSITSSTGSPSSAFS